MLRDVPLEPLLDRQVTAPARPEACPRSPRAHRDELPSEDTPNIGELEAIAAALDAEHFGGLAAGVFIAIDPNQVGDGYFEPGTRKIALRPGMSRSRAVSVMCHELAHAAVDAVHPGLELDDAHGDAFQRVAALVDPDGAPRTKAHAETWRPALDVLDIPAYAAHRVHGRRQWSTRGAA
jgi:hypothetical protein